MSDLSEMRQRPQWPHWLAITLLMLGGAGVLMEPIVGVQLNAQASAGRVTEYVSEIRRVEQSAPDQLATSQREAERYNDDLGQESLHDPWGGDDDRSHPAEGGYGELLSGADAMARIMVPSVDIDLPVYHGTERPTLARGAGHLYGSSLPVGGPGTHAVISAHTGMRAHQYFDRLTEVEVGDRFYLDVVGQRLSYEVDSISLVLPTEIEAVAPVPGEDLVTLLTCHTPPQNLHRLLVRGRRVAAPTAATAEITGVPAPVALPSAQPSVTYQSWMAPRLIVGLVTVILWLGMVTSWISQGRRGRRLAAAPGAPRPPR